MGDPHNAPNLPYNVGTCQAGGVSCCISYKGARSLTRDSSLPPAPRVSSALPAARISFSPTATQLTLTAATGTMPTTTSSMSASTDNRPSLSSSPSSTRLRLEANATYAEHFIYIGPSKDGTLWLFVVLCFTLSVSRQSAEVKWYRPSDDYGENVTMSFDNILAP